MIDAQSGDKTFRQKRADKLVRLRKHPRILHAQANQVIDVKKSAVIDFLSRHPPEGKAGTPVPPAVHADGRSYACRPKFRSTLSDASLISDRTVGDSRGQAVAIDRASVGFRVAAEILDQGP